MSPNYRTVWSTADGDKARKLARWLGDRGIQWRVQTRTVVLVHDDDVEYAREVMANGLEYGDAAQGGA